MNIRQLMHMLGLSKNGISAYDLDTMVLRHGRFYNPLLTKKHKAKQKKNKRRR